MIRSLQMRVNTRTDQYSRLIDGSRPTRPDLIRGPPPRWPSSQERIYQITRDSNWGRTDERPTTNRCRCLWHAWPGRGVAARPGGTAGGCHIIVRAWLVPAIRGPPFRRRWRADPPRLGTRRWHPSDPRRGSPRLTRWLDQINAEAAQRRQVASLWPAEGGGVGGRSRYVNPYGTKRCDYRPPGPPPDRVVASKPRPPARLRRAALALRPGSLHSAGQKPTIVLRAWSGSNCSSTKPRSNSPAAGARRKWSIRPRSCFIRAVTYHALVEPRGGIARCRPDRGQ